MSWLPTFGRSRGSIVVACGIRPKVGFRAAIPQH
jgi:hypothetical protein